MQQQKGSLQSKFDLPIKNASKIQIVLEECQPDLDIEPTGKYEIWRTNYQNQNRKLSPLVVLNDK